MGLKAAKRGEDFNVDFRLRMDDSAAANYHMLKTSLNSDCLYLSH